MIVGRYVARPVEIEAVRLGGMMHRLEVIDWLNEGLKKDEPVLAFLENYSDRIAVKTNHGWAKADEGDWILRVNGEAYPCDNKTFVTKYQEVQQ